MPRAAVVQTSQRTSASYPPTSPQSATACAYLSWVFSSSASIIASSALSSLAAACWIASGATPSSRSRTVEESRTEPTNWRITPSPPDREMLPLCGFRSPAMILVSVVLPDPFAPTSATLAPSPTRNVMSSSNTRPSGNSYPTPATST